MKIKAVIFDMDGLLIDSEPFWRISEIAAFKKLGYNFTDEMCQQTMGYRTDEVVQYWFEKMPWKNRSLKEVEHDIIQGVQELIQKEGKSLPGVISILNFFKNKGLKLALASSSNMYLINAVISKLEIEQYFDEICSAEHESYGKPHPAVFITVANKLGVEPQNCLVFEDSLMGTIAAKAAKMKCVAIPDSDGQNNIQFSIADLQLKSLEEFTASHWQNLNTSNNYNENHIPPARIQNSSIHGKGVFANRTISKGEIITESEMIPILKEHDLPEELATLQFPWNEEYDAICISNVGSFFNHNKPPNAKVTQDKVNNLQQFIANKEIKKGEEIFIYYNDAFENFVNQ